ncbi:hypothetical protein [Furfurilactobacillus cerevisiae]|uniref:hypothetical protein n=1 Tax=Furfurilactobacillus rossiae TaxID=231049 RepID=UPI000E7F8C39|nr:hypothetical protein [Lactobacillus sp.]
MIAYGFKMGQSGIIDRDHRIYWRVPTVLKSIFSVEEKEMRRWTEGAGVLAVAPDETGQLCVVCVYAIVSQSQRINAKGQAPIDPNRLPYIDCVISQINGPALPVFEFVKALSDEQMELSLLKTAEEHLDQHSRRSSRDKTNKQVTGDA